MVKLEKDIFIHDVKSFGFVILVKCELKNKFGKYSQYELFIGTGVMFTITKKIDNSCPHTLISTLIDLSG